MDDFFKQQFDKLLLSTMMLVFLCVIVLFVYYPANEKAIDWAINVFSALSGALLGLITGARLAQRNNPPPDNSTLTSTTTETLVTKMPPIT